MEALFMFHRTIGSDDETATVSERTEKLLFYTSTCGDDLEEQLERLSLCEAFVDLCKGFNQAMPCEAVFLDDHQYSFLECEPDLYLVVCCKSRLASLPPEDLVPVSFSNSSSYAAYSYATPTKKSPIQKFTTFRGVNVGGSSSGGKGGEFFHPERRLYNKKTTKKLGAGTENEDNIRIIEGSDPNSKTLLALLERIYLMFTLFHGRISDLLFGKDESMAEGENGNIPATIKELRKVLRKSRQYQELIDEGDLVPDKKIQDLLDNRPANEDALASLLAISPADKVRQLLVTFVPFFLQYIDFSRLHLLYAINALPHLSVDKTTFLSTELFVSRLMNRFQVIHSGALFLNGQVLWSSLPFHQVQAVHMFLDMYISSRLEENPDAGGANRGFLEIGRKLQDTKEKPIDGADIYLPTVYDIYSNQTSRMAVFELDGALVVVFTQDVEETVHVSSSSTAWNKACLLEFCRDFEMFIVNELSMLIESSTSNMSSNSSGSSSGGGQQGGDNQGSGSNDHPMEGGSSGGGPASQIDTALPQGPDSMERYLYYNESNCVVKISDAWLNSFEQFQRAYPSSQWIGAIFSPNLLSVLNEIRKEFDDSTIEQMTITQYVRADQTQQKYPPCWVSAIKSMKRQIFLVLDAKHSFEYVSQRIRSLRDTTFKSILV